MPVLVCWAVFFPRIEHIPLCGLCHPGVNPTASGMNKSEMFLDFSRHVWEQSLGRNWVKWRNLEQCLSIRLPVLHTHVAPKALNQCYSQIDVPRYYVWDHAKWAFSWILTVTVDFDGALQTTPGPRTTAGEPLVCPVNCHLVGRLGGQNLWYGGSGSSASFNRPVLTCVTR